mmetsp:Transcript_7151/g.14755  ORF Transcript_7151/g.14755 Transcript_7151/m.14755 type:complete len:204 (+) Transcript_7151:577-1188(+)
MQGSRICSHLLCGSHFNTAFGSLSHEQQEAQVNLRKEKKAELCRKMVTQRNAGKKYSDMAHGLCLDKDTGFMFFLPQSKGGGLVCLDWFAFTRVTGIKAVKGQTAEQCLYRVFSYDYGFVADGNMMCPPKPGVRPKLKNGALNGPVVLYHPGFTASSAPPGLTDARKAAQKAKLRKARKARQARKARKSDESDESDESDDDEN